MQDGCRPDRYCLTIEIRVSTDLRASPSPLEQSLEAYEAGVVPFANNDCISSDPKTKTAWTNDCTKEHVKTLLSYIFGDLEARKRKSYLMQSWKREKWLMGTSCPDWRPPGNWTRKRGQALGSTCRKLVHRRKEVQPGTTAMEATISAQSQFLDDLVISPETAIDSMNLLRLRS